MLRVQIFEEHFLYPGSRIDDNFVIQNMMNKLVIFVIMIIEWFLKSNCYCFICIINMFLFYLLLFLFLPEYWKVIKYWRVFNSYIKYWKVFNSYWRH